MQLEDLIINDVQPLQVTEKISDVQLLLNQLTYSHVPIMNNEVYVGCISDTDVHCFESHLVISDCLYALEGFFVRPTTNWLDVLEAFAIYSTNIMPVLDKDNRYLGYYEINDIITLFNETPFLSEAGGILIVEKGMNDYSFSEIAQITESNNAKILGAFISKIDGDLVQITLKIGNTSLNEVIQTFRRYSYNIISGHEEDSFLENLKSRSKYLDKYLNI